MRFGSRRNRSKWQAKEVIFTTAGRALFHVVVIDNILPAAHGKEAINTRVRNAQCNVPDPCRNVARKARQN
jgi:hypothetical protein